MAGRLSGISTCTCTPASAASAAERRRSEAEVRAASEAERKASEAERVEAAEDDLFFVRVFAEAPSVHDSLDDGENTVAGDGHGAGTADLAPDGNRSLGGVRKTVTQQNRGLVEEVLFQFSFDFEGGLAAGQAVHRDFSEQGQINLFVRTDDQADGWFTFLQHRVGYGFTHKERLFVVQQVHLTGSRDRGFIRGGGGLFDRLWILLAPRGEEQPE